MNKRGLSAVIGTLIMVALTITAVMIVWGAVNIFINENLDPVKTCSNLYGKVEFNSRYTCYNSSSGEVQFGIIIRDVEIDGAAVIISSISSSENYELTNEWNDVSGLMNITRGSSVKLPGKNGAQTYIASGFSDKPEEMEIATIIDGKQCGISDSFSSFDECLLLVN